MAFRNKQSFWLSTLTGAAVLGASTLVYLHLGEPSLLRQETEFSLPPSEATPTSSRFVTLQSQIEADTQNADLWFEIGHEYMERGEFNNAGLVYHYAERLSDAPRAEVYAAQATARYYANSQQMDAQTERWLSQALALEADNAAALMLLAGDYFLSARYQLAIEHWEALLDANHQDTDREAIIRAIHQAERLM